MRTKNLIASFFILIFFCGCESPKYLSDIQETGTNQYGSQISIFLKPHGYLRGELLALDSINLIIIPDYSGQQDFKPMLVPISKIKKFNLRYARPKNYGWSIPVFVLATISHGWFAVLSLPVNLIVTIAVTSGGANSFMYKSDEISYTELKKFARYPQGIPPGFDLSSIH